MGIQIERLCTRRLSFAGDPGLPPGVRQADCDGRMSEGAEADGDFLWHSCDERQQERLSERFLQVNAERLRDALLDAQDGAGLGAAPAHQESGASMGRLLWILWISYRDRMLREMVRRGEISSI